MSIIDVPTLKKSEYEKVILTWLKYICNFVRRRKLGNIQEQISQEMLKQFPLILICEVVYM